MRGAEWVYKPNGELLPGQSLPDGVSRLAMSVEYDGAAYCGWQRQSHSPSVQALVEKALSVVAAESIQVACAGRTDTGVHATSQIVHFDTSARRDPHNWQLGCISNLPADIAINWVKSVPAQFHARFSALSRTYRYVILNKRHRPAILSSAVSWVRPELDHLKMADALACLRGRHDFSSFRAAGCSAKTPVREVSFTDVRRVGDLIVIEITANAFLQHMVRNIVGALIEIASEDLSPEHMAQLLAGRDRKKSAMTAAPNGLYLVDVEYPSEFGLPPTKRGPAYLDAIFAAEN